MGYSYIRLFVGSPSWLVSIAVRAQGRLNLPTARTRVRRLFSLPVIVPAVPFQRIVLLHQVLPSSDRDGLVPKQPIDRLVCNLRRHSGLRSCAALAAPPIHADRDRSMMGPSLSGVLYSPVHAASVHGRALPLFASALAASDWRSVAPHVFS